MTVVIEVLARLERPPEGNRVVVVLPIWHAFSIESVYKRESINTVVWSFIKSQTPKLVEDVFHKACASVNNAFYLLTFSYYF